MALNWNIEHTKHQPRYIKGVENSMGGFRLPRPDDKPEDIEDFLNPVINAIIWATIAVDMGRITEKNWKEFYRRMRMLDIVEGRPYFQEPYKLTPDLIKGMIGLHTNVITKPASSFNAKVARIMTSKIDKELEE